MLSSTVSTFCGASIAHRRPLHVRRLRMARCHVAHAIAKLAPPGSAADDEALDDALLVTINGIAAGMQKSG